LKKIFSEKCDRKVIINIVLFLESVEIRFLKGEIEVSKSSFCVYIDESGDEGFDFEKRTPEWFIISAAITRSVKDLETLTGIIKPMRELFKYGPTQEIHFRKLTHEKRVPYVEKIASAQVRSVTIAVHKPSLTSQETFRAKNRLYFYVCRFLLERVSWFCRDSFDPRKHEGDGSIDLIFSKRKNLSYEELRCYLKKLHEQSACEDIRIEWSKIKEDQIKAYSSSQRMGLQVADAIATSAFYALNKTGYGFTEDKYVSILLRGMYKHQGKLLGYGLKLWPLKDEEVLNDIKYKWIPENVHSK